jgi:RimJ/RimL family protein N-acetyltransferase
MNLNPSLVRVEEMISIENLSVEFFGLAAQWLSKPEINRWLTTEWRNREVNSATLAIVMRNKRNRLYLVEYEGQPCGLVGLADIDAGDKTAMVWYLLGDKSFSRKGIISEAVRQLVQLTFVHDEIVSLYAWAMADNLPSRGVLRNAGFSEVGRVRHAACSDGRQIDRVYFDIIAEQSAFA